MKSFEAMAKSYGLNLETLKQSTLSNNNNNNNNNSLSSPVSSISSPISSPVSMSPRNTYSPNQSIDSSSINTPHYSSANKRKISCDGGDLNNEIKKLNKNNNPNKQSSDCKYNNNNNNNNNNNISQSNKPNQNNKNDDYDFSSMTKARIEASKGDINLNDVDCYLETDDLWKKFHELGTEMIITKSGRRMFPPLRVSFGEIKLTQKYIIAMDIVPTDSKRYRYAYHRSSWLVAGKADPPVQSRLFIHPDGPFTGDALFKQIVSFEKVKLTNNEMDRSGHVSLSCNLIYIFIFYKYISI